MIHVDFIATIDTSVFCVLVCACRVWVAIVVCSNAFINVTSYPGFRNEASLVYIGSLVPRLPSFFNETGRPGNEATHETTGLVPGQSKSGDEGSMSIVGSSAESYIAGTPISLHSISAAISGLQ